MTQSHNHKEMSAGCIQQDIDDFTKIIFWICSHIPFNVGDKLVCLYSRLVNDKDTVNCDKPKEAGAVKQKTLDREKFVNCSLKGKTKSHLYNVFKYHWERRNISWFSYNMSTIYSCHWKESRGRGRKLFLLQNDPIINIIFQRRCYKRFKQQGSVE